MQQTPLHRAQLLLGSSAIQLLQSTPIIIFGVGGVGSWCAEALIRTGVKDLTIVDHDTVAISNLNRQLMATTSTLGQPKVQALQARLLDIAPDAHISAIQDAYTSTSAHLFHLDSYHIIIDAIDSLQNKAHLILQSLQTPATLLSSMGAARKTDPTQIQVANFYDAHGCPLARALRKKFKHDNTIPSRPFTCVFSPELQPNLQPDPLDPHTNGSIVPVTASFGLILASETIKIITKK